MMEDLKIVCHILISRAPNYLKKSLTETQARSILDFY